MLIWKGDRRPQSYTKYYQKIRNDIAFPLEDHINWFSKTKWTVLKIMFFDHVTNHKFPLMQQVSHIITRADGYSCKQS